MSSTVRSNSARAGLIFPVGRTKRYMKNFAGKGRVSQKGAVYLAGVLQYFTDEALRISGDVATDNKKKIILARHINLALRGDQSLDEMLGGRKYLITKGGVVPRVESKLLPHKKQAKQAGEGEEEKKKKKNKTKDDIDENKKKKKKKVTSQARKEAKETGV